MITLTLPELPPPLSACFNNARGPGRVKSKRYRAWIELCRYQHSIDGWNGRDCSGPVAVEYRYCRPRNADGQESRVKRDLGNLEKATSDMLVALGVIEDDSLIHDLRLTWGATEPVEITVRAL